jgi:uncharacterized membrane protein YkvA (DUF1232 family)
LQRLIGPLTHAGRWCEERTMGPSSRTTWRDRVRALKRDVVAIALAMRDPRVPWYAKAVGVCVVAYALSPIDLIPDFIPVLGLVDDLVLVPLGLLLVVRLIPPDILAEHRLAAAAVTNRPVSRAGAAFIIAIWLLAAALLAALAARAFGVDSINIIRGGSAPS